QDAENLIVSPSRIVRRLHEEVRCPIDRIAGGIERVVQTTASSGSVDEEVCREVAATDGGLRCLDSETEGKLAEVLHDAEPVGALPSPADDVLRIDLEREGFLAVGDALLAFGHEAPHLAAGDRETVCPGHVRPQLPLTEHIAVALAAAGGSTGPEDIRSVLAGQLCYST